MNTASILRHLQQLAPEAIGLRIEDQGRGVYALHWMRDGRPGAVLFDATGMIGVYRGSISSPARSDLDIAAELAKAIKA